MKHLTLPNVRKIAVVRVNGLGDLLFTMPALEALRAAYPSAEIVLLGKAWHASFLSGRPGPVDRVVVVPPYPGVGDREELPRDSDELRRFFESMARERFDLALQFHGGGRYSNPFTLRLGARVTAGLKSPEAVPLDRWAPYFYFQPEVFRYLEVAALVGAAPVVLEPRVKLRERDRAEADMALADDGRPLAVIHPGVTDGRRRWPAAKFAAVGDALAGAGARVAVTGARHEAPLVRSVLESMREEAVDLSARLSLGGLAGVLARAAVVAANDSGPLHLAAAVGTATVGIFWCGNLINAGRLTRARHRPVLSWRLDCPVCGRDCIRDDCRHHESFVGDIPADAVIPHALDLLTASACLVS